MINELLLTTWLCLPIAPLNPIEEDTLASTNLHLTTGVASPNGIVSAGPIVSAKYELLLVHPFMTRAAVDFRYGRMSSNLFPQGGLYAMTYGLDVFYYRGTNHLTAYIGAGAVYAFHHFDADRSVRDSMFVLDGTTAIDIQQQFGYRLTLGLRYHRAYSLEVAIMELRPDFKWSGRDPSGVEMRRYETTRTGSFRISLGYLFEI